MATQGLVTVISAGKVIMKIIAGSDGYNVRKVANELKKRWPVNAEQAYEIAIRNHFGGTEDLVVIDGSSVVFKGDDEIHPRYRETFEQSRFNPRWEKGTADYVLVIALPYKPIESFSPPS